MSNNPPRLHDEGHLIGVGKPIFGVYWSPREAAFIAYTDSCPGQTFSDPWTASAAIRGLQDKIREGGPGDLDRPDEQPPHL
ncbi:hypothetical protein [Nocardia brasiliensis]|uniref:hypothetical protein n=1 Tax=Nocardia brasiliensis TaxID=37326 RepID=UPI002453A23E|nr:hypothetical protein [Nocardia brasiliensis]